MYMVACLLSDTEYLRVNDYAEFLDMKIEQDLISCSLFLWLFIMR